MCVDCSCRKFIKVTVPLLPSISSVVNQPGSSFHLLTAKYRYDLNTVDGTWSARVFIWGSGRVRDVVMVLFVVAKLELEQGTRYNHS